MVNPQEAAEVSTATLMATLKCLTLSATLITSNAPENAREESIDTVREIILESLNGPLSKEAILKLIKKREEIDNAAAI
jgi:type IV secretory pathway VirB2 component (pilin)